MHHQKLPVDINDLTSKLKNENIAKFLFSNITNNAKYISDTLFYDTFSCSHSDLN